MRTELKGRKSSSGRTRKTEITGREGRATTGTGPRKRQDSGTQGKEEKLKEEKYS